MREDLEKYSEGYRKKYYLAKELLNQILYNDSTNDILNIIPSIYGSNKTLNKNTLAHIDNFNAAFHKGTAREHNYNASREIYETRKKLAYNNDFQEIQQALLKLQKPPIAVMEIMFGKYVNAVMKSYEMFLEKENTGQLKES